MYCKIEEYKADRNDGKWKEVKIATHLIQCDIINIERPGCSGEYSVNIPEYKPFIYNSRIGDYDEDEPLTVASIYLINDSGKTVDSYKY